MTAEQLEELLGKVTPGEWVLKREITPEILKEFLDYNHDTGLLFWKERAAKWFVDSIQGREYAARCWNGRMAGKPALTALDGHGYRHGNIFNQRNKAHRVAWAIHTGKWPDNEIDHINGNRQDNRICNLREATGSQNICNVPLRADNTSGLKGVSWHKGAGKWMAQIKFNGYYRYLGLFTDKESAHMAWSIAADKMHKEYKNDGRPV